jgi:sec-independent protein translocase protein TatC
MADEPAGPDSDREGGVADADDREEPDSGVDGEGTAETDGGPAESGEDPATGPDRHGEDADDAGEGDDDDDGENGDSTGGLRRIDDGDTGNGDRDGGLRRVDDDADRSRRAADAPVGPARPPGDDAGPARPPGGPNGGDTGDGGEDRATASRPEGPPPGHAVGAPSPGEVTGEPAGTETTDEGGSLPDYDEMIPEEQEIGSPTGGLEYESDYDPETPPDDEEMPLTEHIEEMVIRVGIVAVAVALTTGVVFLARFYAGSLPIPSTEAILVRMWQDLLPPAVGDPHLYGPLEKVLVEIKVASLAGVLVAMPVLVYEAYLFMRPGLYPRERRYFLSAVPTSFVLGVVGMLFAYLAVLPVLFDYFVVYSEDAVSEGGLNFSLQVTFDLIVAMLSSFALVFQIPLFIMLAIWMNVTTRRWIEGRRLYFWGGFLGAAFLLGGADLTGVAPIIIAATMIGLFEGTLLLLRWTGN